MKFNSVEIIKQPYTAIATAMVAAALLLIALVIAPANEMAQIGPASIVLALLLAGCVILAYHFPIHLSYHMKLELTSLPLYLLAMLLPLPLAIVTAGFAVGTAELLVRSKRGNLISDIVVQTTRMMICTGVAHFVYALLLRATDNQLLGLSMAALVMWMVECATLPLLATPVTGTPALQIIREAVMDGGTGEAAQYITGIVGAMASQQDYMALLALLMPAILAYRSFKIAREMQTGTRAMLENLADMVDLRDSYTGGHSRRVTEYTEGILRSLNLSGPDADLILTAARVHDIGKIGVPDYVLHKPGPLTPEERAIMETHSARGADLLKRYRDFARGVAIVRHHHESWDGKGYPDKLSATEIPLGARIIAVADSFDAMTSDRPYRSGMSIERATAILRNGRAQQWDAQIVDAFMVYITEAQPQTEREKVAEPLRPALSPVA